MEEKTFMTQEGLEKTKERLDYLKSVKRQEVAKKLAEARSYGDLSENSEYDIARDEQAAVETEIFDLENKLKTVEIIDAKKVNTNKVSVGCKVSVTNVATKQSFEYTIVGDTESDPLNGLISNASPIGAGLIDKKVGEIAQIKTPAGLISFKIEKIK
ncbi:MAG: transcription elongation factor GreA [Clostridia bacterium]|nr:transcription elongation factor GreA [Clostridia bacterium]